MKLPRPSRWGAAALAVLLAATAASAEEPGTITITGTFNMDDLSGTVGADLAGVFDNGGEHTWSLTLHGCTYSHYGSDPSYGSHRITMVYPTSFDLEFSGPDAETLNEVVAGGLVGGEVTLGLGNTYQSWGDDFATITLGLFPPDGGVTFWAYNDIAVSSTLFPADADGYPVVESDPASIYCEVTSIYDERPGSAGILSSWNGTVTVAGDLGSPIPATLRIVDGSVIEGNRGNTKLRLSVTLANTSDQTITVSYRTVNGTAVEKSDYTAASGTVTFQPGETAKTITIPIKADRNKEANETFTVELFNAVGTTIEDGVATVTVVNDD